MGLTSVLVPTAAAILLTTISMAVALLRRISASVGVAPPPMSTKDEQQQQHCALFRHLPTLASKLAWRSLGVTQPTPIHKCRLPSRRASKSNSDEMTQLQFLLKREDLISNRYGGNKVRTLQHQLAVCEARRDRGERAYQNLVSIGSGGSNQVIATVVHAQSLGWDNNNNSDDDDNQNTITPFWFDKDQPDLDNTLNMLSVLSFSNTNNEAAHDWGGGLLATIRALWQVGWKQETCIPMMLGGNCPAGVLGQAGGMLELAEQVVAGDCPDPERIYLPIGSACTISGLIVGTLLVRHLGLQAFRHKDFTIVGANVHEGFAAGDRLFGLHTNPLFRWMPLTISHSVLTTCQTLVELGGPDLAPAAKVFLKQHVEIRSDKNVVGIYGGHSKLSREAANYYDEHGQVTSLQTGRKEKDLWMCGHFVSKAFQPLLQDLEDLPPHVAITKKNYMLWMTKSAVQPRGSVDEWPAFLKKSNAVKQWANEGVAESKRRPGNVSTITGTPQDYRPLMTKLE